MKRRAIMVVLVALASTCASAQPASAASAAGTPWLAEPDFWVAAAANLAGIGLFMARVYWPEGVPGLGIGTEALGIPALAVGIVDLATGTADAATVGVLAYAGWALGATLVDHVFRLEYRDPVNPAILVPYVVVYYVGIGLLSATQLTNGTAPWIIAGSTCILAVGASFFARAMGRD